MKFAQLGLKAPFVRALTKIGHVSPTPIQVLAVPEALGGRDILASAETGTGKTAAFALPLLQRLSQTHPARHPLTRRVRALIVAPTQDLAVDIAGQLTALGRYSDLSHCIVANTDGSTPVLPRSVDILIATPARLLDLQQHGGVDLRAVEIFVIDEADRMLDMGFLPDVQRIVSQLPLDRQTMLFSATMPVAIGTLADSILRDPARIRIPPTQKAAEVISQSVCFIPRPQKTALLVAWLTHNSISRALVFTRTKQGADRVVRQLLSWGIRAEAIHGDKSQAARQQSLARFKSSQPLVLVATDLATRGLDVDNVTHVLNYDLPLEPETYIHRIGRTARAGAKGMAVTFCDENEKPLLKGIEKLLRREIPVDDDLKPLDRPPTPPAATVETSPAASRPSRRRRTAEAAAAELAEAEATRPRSTRAKRATAIADKSSAKSSETHAKSKSQPKGGSGRGRTGSHAKSTGRGTSSQRTAAKGSTSSKKTSTPTRGAVASRRR